jgi:predicted small lipoprotein YifL
MQRFLTLMLLLAASAISLTGCGNKGPLYLPQAPVQQISTPAEVPEEASDKTVESEVSSDAPEDSSEDSPENTEAAEEPETTEAD